MRKILILIAILLTISSCVKQSQKPDKVTQANWYSNQGLKYTLKNDNKTAILYYDSAIALHHAPLYYNNRGSSKYELGDTIGAFADYSFALYLDSLDGMALSNIAGFYQDKKEYKVALHYYRRSSQTSDKRAILDLMGYCEYMLGNYKEALTYYKKHLEGKNPLYPEYSVFWMGNCYEKLGDINAAKEHWEKAAKMGEEEAQHKLDSMKRR